MRIPLLPLAAVALSLGAIRGFAAPTPAPTPAKALNLLDNGGFEKSTIQDNLWDGVNGDNNLVNPTFSASVVTEKGTFGPLAMPPDVAWVDLNGDGKPDLVTSDPTGFFRFYPNSGTPTEPKFTSAEIIPIFVSTCFQPRHWDYDWNDNTDEERFCPRFALADWRHSGVLDFLIGNYYGETMFIPNSGSARSPQFHPPADINKLRVATHDQGRFWANLLTPIAYDWNGTGRPDMITGEGTYSANSIHVLQNVASGGETPKFSNTKHTYLAYGEGREQLWPCIVDYNGDGNPDLLVADRTGEVGVYLNPGKPKPGVKLERTATITFGSTSKLPGLCSICAGDYNGDGLFDLILGLPNGHIAVALNTGTKSEPKFGPPQDIKGVDRLVRNVQTPDGWTTQNWAVYGNAYAYFNVVNAQSDPESKPPEGGNCLKMAYWPSAGQTFPMPAENLPGAVRHFTLMRKKLTLKINKKYKFTCKVKGANAESMRWLFHCRYYGYPGPTKLEHDERGGAKKGGELVSELADYGGPISPGTTWNVVQGEFTPHFKSPLLAGETTMDMTFYIDVWAANMSTAVYVDDLVLVEE